jgi:hypothetical protein
MRREGPEPDRPPEKGEKVYQSEWIVTLTNRVDGESVTWIPTSLNDLKRRASVIFANYTPTTYGHRRHTTTRKP